MLEHNQKTYQDVVGFIDQGQDCCVVNPCGSGKSSVMAKLIKREPESTYLILTRQKNAESYYRHLDAAFRGRNVRIMTYTRMLRLWKQKELESMAANYYLVDEAHYVGAEQYRMAYQGVRDCFHPRCIGFTATPQRFEDQGTDRTVVEEYFGGHIAGNFSTQDLEEKGVFVQPDYVMTLYGFEEMMAAKQEEVELSDLSEYQKEHFRIRLQHTLATYRRSASPEVILSKRLKSYCYKPSCNRILVYTPNIQKIPELSAYINHLVEDILDQPVKSYVYTYKTGETEIQKFLEEDDTYCKILYSIDKVMETIHIDDLRILIMLRPSVSNRIITQQFGRVNSIGNRQRALIVDMVDNLRDLVKPKEHEGIVKKNEGKYEPRFQFPQLFGDTYDIFHRIDEAVSAVEGLHYGQFYGTITQLCQIYRKEKRDVEDWMQQGCTLEEAFEKVPSKPWQPPRQRDESYEVTEEVKKNIEQYMPITEMFIAKRKIMDEDIQQDLRLQSMYTIAKLSKVRAESRKQYFRNELGHIYIRLARQKLYEEQRDICEEPVTMSAEEEAVQNVAQEAMRKGLEKALGSMNARTRSILTMRFGLDGGEPLELEEIGKKYDVSRERVRQIIAKGLRTLRHPRYCGDLKNYID